MKSAAAGYLALALSAALVFLVLRWAGVATAEEFVTNSQVKELANPTSREILLSACGAVAGMMLSYRLNLIPGASIALIIIEAAAMVGITLAAGEPALMYEGVERFGLDALLMVAGGVLVVLLKQITIFHRRAPMVEDDGSGMGNSVNQGSFRPGSYYVKSKSGAETYPPPSGVRSSAVWLGVFVYLQVRVNS